MKNCGFTDPSEEGVLSLAFRGSLSLMGVRNKDQIQEQADTLGEKISSSDFAFYIKSAL